MGVWGVEGGPIDNERLSPLGLICWGGSSNQKDGMTYHVYSKNGKEFDVNLTLKEFNRVDEIYKKFKNNLRKEKLKKLNDNKSIL